MTQMGKDRQDVGYKGRLLTCSHRADFICFGSIIVELKALSDITDRESSQIINYLKATGLSRGLPLNFGTPRLVYRRYILSHHDLRPSASSADGRPQHASEVSRG